MKHPDSPPPVRVDVWSDVVCPWCRIGLHRLRRVAHTHAIPVEVVHHAFQLDPARTASGPTRDHLARRYGGDVEAMLRNAERAGEAEGVRLRLHDSIACNTRDAHRVVAYAQAQGRQDEALVRLMRGHFEEALDLGDRDVLSRLAADAGLDASAVALLLSGDDFQEDVQADLDQARALRITGVPFFVFAGRLAFSGAQPDAIFLEALRKAAEPSPAPPPAPPTHGPA